MATKKIYRFIELALEQTEQKKWSQAAAVTVALLTCPRAQGIAANMIYRYKINEMYQEEIVSDIATIMQMKMIDKLDAISSVYYVYYKVAMWVCSNYRKKSSQSVNTPEKSFSDFSFQDETLVEVMDRLQPEVNEGESEAVIHAIDLDKARQLFQQKVAEQGWPEHIQRNRTRRGRPLKVAA